MSRSQLSILLVEDDESDAELIQAIMLKAGFNVRWTHVKAEAELAPALRNASYNLVFCDYGIPGFRGERILELCRAAEMECPFIFVSDELGEEKAVELLRLGATDCVSKGRLQRLVPSVQRALDDARWRAYTRQAQEETRIALEQLTESEARYREAADQEKLARKQAEQANRVKDEFLATVSHELRTPLAAITGWIHMIRAGNLPPEDVDRGFQVIDRNARAQSRIIEDLLDVSRVVSGKLSIERSPVEVSAILGQVVESLRPAALDKEIRVHLDFEGSPVVLGDGHRLGQVFSNLVSNAIKFSNKGSDVHVIGRLLPGQVEVVVADSGCGIPPEALRHIFEPFRQVDGSTTRKQAGLGLGLAIVRQILSLHGGHVTVDSAGSNLGATFTVSLPVVHPSGQRETAELLLAELASRPELENLDIIVVDDEADLRNLVAAILRSCGARVQTCSSAAEAYEQLRQRNCSILIADIGMPTEDGYSLLRRVRELPGVQRNVPAVALTAYTGSGEQSKALSAGFNAWLPKPFIPGALLDVIVSLTSKRR